MSGRSTAGKHIWAPRPQQLWIGLAQALAAIAALTAAFAFISRGLGYPSAETLRSIAGIGVAFVLGYVLEAVWLVNRAEYRERHEEWLGFVCGVGVAGLLGIVAALAAAAHLEAGHRNLLDDLGLWWAVSSLGMLGLLVALQPFLTDRENRKDLEARPRSDANGLDQIP